MSRATEHLDETATGAVNFYLLVVAGYRQINFRAYRNSLQTFARHYLPWFTFVFLEHLFEESLRGISIALLLKEYIHNFTILIYRVAQTARQR